MCDPRIKFVHKKTQPDFYDVYCIGNEVMVMPTQMQVFIRRWRPSTYTVDTYNEVILTDATPIHLKQQVCSILYT